MKSTNRLFVALLIILTLPRLAAGSAGICPYKELRGRLFVNGRPIGQPLSSKHPEVRIVRVESSHEAQELFLGMCPGCRIIRRMYKEEEWFACRLPPQYGGWLYYTSRPLRGWHLAGTVYVRSPLLNRWGFKEIRFVETIKIKK